MRLFGVGGRWLRRAPAGRERGERTATVHGGGVGCGQGRTGVAHHRRLPLGPSRLWSPPHLRHQAAPGDPSSVLAGHHPPQPLPPRPPRFPARRGPADLGRPDRVRPRPVSPPPSGRAGTGQRSAPSAGHEGGDRGGGHRSLRARKSRDRAHATAPGCSGDRLHPGGQRARGAVLGGVGRCGHRAAGAPGRSRWRGLGGSSRLLLPPGAPGHRGRR